MMNAKWLSFVATTFGLVLAACGTTDVEGDAFGDTNFARKSASTNGADSANACNGDGLPQIAPHDPNKFPKCPTAVGSARCIPESELGVFADKIKGQAAQQAAGQQEFLQACQGGYCIPDELVASGGAPPKECVSINGAGVCLDLSIPLVAQYKDLLPQEKCPTTQRCTPCDNPLAAGAPTGACLIGKGPKPGETCTKNEPTGGGDVNKKPVCPYVGPPIIDPATFAACGEGAHCVGTAMVPDPKMTALLKTCTAKDGKQGVCAPDEFISSAGNFFPATCDSILGNEGRCMNINIPQVEAQKTFLPQSTCKAFERCTPCTNPVDGKPTGACSQSCDPGPKKPAVVFQPCAKKAGQEQKGVCVPTDIIPKEMQTFLKPGTCDKAQKCAPKDLISTDATFAPPRCNGKVKILGGFLGSISYSGGVCLSDLVDTPGDRGSCLGGQECVPCTHPLNKKPTGAPGCK